MRPIFLTICGGLFCAAGCAWAADVAVSSEAATGPLILQIRVVEGDAASYPAGSRSIKGITVEVTDEAGLPVSGAAVSFRLPEDGPSGVFQNGARTEIASTSASGRATVWGMKWNRVPGSMVVRVTAAKGETRAGALVTQVLLEPSQASAAAALAAKRDPTQSYRIRPNRRWLWVSAVAAAAAGGGLAFGARSGSGAGSTVSAAGSNSAVVIGSPSISVGR